MNESSGAVLSTFNVRDDGQVDAQLVGDFSIFNEALSDSISSLPPRHESGNGPSTYWVDVARNALKRHLLAATEGVLAGGNSTSIHLQDGHVVAMNDYGTLADAETLSVDDFVNMLEQWRALILDQISRATKPLPETHRRNGVAPIKAPERTEIERKWRALTSGEADREETARWARAWAWTDEQLELEPLAMNAFETLDGFDMTHDPINPNLVAHGGRDQGRPYVHSDQHVADELDRWTAMIEEHDKDPQSFFERIRARSKPPDQG